MAGWVWPWMEIFGSATAPAMRVVNSFLDPILKDALAKAQAKTEDTQPIQGKDGDIGGDDTLLDHLVRYTTGSSAEFIISG